MKYTTKMIGLVAVDSGQLMLCDPSYISGEKWDKDAYSPENADRNGMYSFNYNGACGATLSEERAGQLKFENNYEGAGVAFSSGLGDGMYPVYATYVDDPDWGLRICKVEVVMIEMEEE